jgi:hypothetical protein
MTLARLERRGRAPAEEKRRRIVMINLTRIAKMKISMEYNIERRGVVMISTMTTSSERSRELMERKERGP